MLPRKAPIGPHIRIATTTAKKPQGWLVLEDREFGDFTLEADVTDLGGRPGTCYGLMFRMVGLRGLLFTVSTEHKNAQLRAIKAYHPKLVAGAPDHLDPGGWLVLEIAPAQAGRVREACEAAGLRKIAVRRDLADRERVVVARAGGED